jgi:hypothetical protein
LLDFREAFKDSELIYTGSGCWKSAEQCIWEAIFPCSVFSVLSDLYGDCGKLFRKVLRVKNAGLHELILELEHVSLGQQKRRANAFASLLPALDQFLGDMKPSAAQKKRLRAIQMFWVSPYDTDGQTAKARLASARQRFWIADVSWLEVRFEGFVPLFSLSRFQSASNLNNVFRDLGMDHKKLSSCVERELLFRDDAPVFEREFTARLQKQVPYILGLVPYIL